MSMQASAVAQVSVTRGGDRSLDTAGFAKREVVVACRWVRASKVAASGAVGDLKGV